ncbi:MAG TPA: NAD-dependent epimerase/dehydratase family protein [Aliidongia sp.]|nr:NAD-dependent epimerase/dehydratase family protein [Aliidongia sp.]
MARYTVTGGCGFIGSHLVDSLLADGHEVVVLDDLSTGKRENLDRRAKLIVGDVTRPALVGEAMEGAEGCFHLAAIASVARSNEDWLGTHRVNLTGSITIFDAARPRGAAAAIPVVYASSAAVYGDTERMPIDEATPTRPLTAYGADKLGSELHGKVATHVHGVPTTGLRFFNVYGPRQDPASPYSGVISIFADRLAARKPVTVNGDGLQSRDFVYVADVVAHLRAAMKTSHTEARVFNVCTGRATTIGDLARLIAMKLGIEADIAHGPARAGDIRHSIGTPERAIAGLGVRAAVAIEDGLGRLLDAIGRAR